MKKIWCNEIFSLFKLNNSYKKCSKNTTFKKGYITVNEYTNFIIYTWILLYLRIKKEQSKLTFTGSQKASTKPAVKRFQPDSSNTSNNSMDELSLISEQFKTMNKKH